jgi:hypothetical protein
MHLKEYAYRELTRALKGAGFSRPYYVVPPKVLKLLSRIGIRKQEQIIGLGILYLNLLLILEKALLVVPSHQLRHLCTRVLRRLLIFSDSIFLVAQK